MHDTRCIWRWVVGVVSASLAVGCAAGGPRPARAPVEMVPIGVDHRSSFANPVPKLARHEPIHNGDVLVPAWEDVLDAADEAAASPRPAAVAAPARSRLERHRGFSPRAYLRGFSRRTPGVHH